MSDSSQTTITFQRDTLGARGIEHYARNPDCLRLAALTLMGVSPTQAVSLIYGEHAQHGQSPFAMHVGHRFEQAVFANHAEALIELYIEQGRLNGHHVDVIHVEQTHPGVSADDLIQRRLLSLRVLQSLRGCPSNRATLLIHPRLTLTFFDECIDIEPDAILIMPHTAELFPVEVKSYVDRGGYTSSSSLQSACRQAAVGVVALRQNLGDDVGAHVDLILRHPARFAPTLRPMRLNAEVESIHNAIEHMTSRHNTILELLGQPELGIQSRADFERLPNRFCDECKTHCALSSICKQEAFQQGNPMLLGDQAAEFLRVLESIDDVWALLNHDRPPASSEEEALLANLQQLQDALLRIDPDMFGGEHDQ